MRIGVLASGSGTNFAAIVEAGLPVAVLAVDRVCAAEQLAEAHKVPTIQIPRAEFGSPIDRVSYSRAMVEALQPFNLDLIILAGFMTVLDELFVNEWPGRVLNTHPSLLPAYPGAHAVRDAMKAGAKITGCTIHIVTPKVDDGPILAQEAINILPEDTEESLHERIKEIERRLYPQTIKEFISQWPNAH